MSQKIAACGSSYRVHAIPILGAAEGCDLLILIHLGQPPPLTYAALQRFRFRSISCLVVFSSSCC
jgi:hypothetical protein